MKRIIILLIVAAALSGAAFARGAEEGAAQGRNAAGQNAVGRNAEGTEIALSGVVTEVDGRIVIESSDGLYSLSAPGFPRTGLDLPIGRTVDVEGLVVDEGCEDCVIGADGHVFVTRAEIDGEEYVFERGRGASGSGRFADGRRTGGRDGNRGSRNAGNGRFDGRFNGSRDGSRGGRFSTES